MRCPSLTELPTAPPDKTDWPWTEESPQLSNTSPSSHLWPRISIVTPSYNQGQFIEETIRSVLLQGYPNLEYIVMDGGSTDQSSQVINRYRPWLSYVYIGTDGGQAAAIDSGFQHATGEVLAWLNSDDRYRPGALVRVGRFFRKYSHIVFANGDVNFIDAEGRFVQRIYSIHPNRFLTSNLGGHGWPQQGCFWQRWAYERVGGIDRSLRFCLDRDLFIRLTSIGPSKRFPGRPLADFRVHDKAKSSTILDIGREENVKLLIKYANPFLRSINLPLWPLWWFWCKPTNLRARLNRRYGWEW